MPRDEAGAHSPEPLMDCAKLGAYPELQKNWWLQNTGSAETDDIDGKAERSTSQPGETSPDHKDNISLAGPLSVQNKPVKETRHLETVETSRAEADGSVEQNAESSLDEQLYFALTDTLETAKSAPSMSYEAALHNLDVTCRELKKKSDQAETAVPDGISGEINQESGNAGEEMQSPVRWAPEKPQLPPKETPKPNETTPKEREKPGKVSFQQNPGMAIAAAMMAFMAIASGYAITSGVAGTLKDVKSIWPLSQADVLTSWFHQPEVTHEIAFSENIRFAKLVAAAKSGPETISDAISDFDPDVVMARMATTETGSSLSDHEYIKAKQREVSAANARHSHNRVKFTPQQLSHDDAGVKPAYEFNSDEEKTSNSAEFTLIETPDEKSTGGGELFEPDLINGNQVDIRPVTMAANLEQRPSDEISPDEPSDNPAKPADAPNNKIDRPSVVELRQAMNRVRGINILQQSQREQLIAKLSRGECLVPTLSSYFKKVPVVTMRDLAQLVDVDC